MPGNGDAFEGHAILGERWLPIVGFEDLYEVSDHGRVRRTGQAARTGRGRGGGARLGRMLRDQPVPGGYRKVQLWRSGRPTNHLVHRLVVGAFIGPLPNGQEVNHIDGDKTNNRVLNLEYVTRSENLAHAYRIGLRTVTVGQMARARKKAS